MPSHGIVSGGFNWLFEEQIRIGKPKVAWFYRTIDEVVTTLAQDDAATVAVDFDPHYEDLKFHHALIIRGDDVIEIPVESRYMLMRREKGFEHSMLDGQWTLGATLPDVRVGDIIDIAFTCEGQPTIFGDRFGPSIWMQGGRYHECRRVRLLNTKGHPLYVQPFPMGCPDPKFREGVFADYDEYVFEDTQVEPYFWEPDTPDWLRLWRGFFVSNIKTWGELADIERHGYEPEPDYPQGLLDAIAEIEKQFSEPAERIAEALRYVQGHIRYFSVSMGTGGYVPRPLKEIFYNRMGDCKDVSKLLVAMLRKMGFEAHAALVDTHFGLDLIHSLPRIWAFNHAITMVEFEGRPHFLDATGFVQYGKLGVLDESDHGYALPLKANSELIPMASGKGGLNESRALPLTYEVTETIHLPENSSSECQIDIDYNYGGSSADYVRYSLSNTRLNNFAKDTCELYAELYGHETVCSIPVIEDEREENRLTIRQSIKTRDPWLKTARRERRLFVSPEGAFSRILGEAGPGIRLFPYDIGPARRVRHVTRLKTGMALALPVGQKKWQFGPLSFSFEGVTQGQDYVATREYATTKSYLTPGDKEKLDRAFSEIDSYDRISIIVHDNRVFSWWRGARQRLWLWAAPAVGLIIWLMVLALISHRF